MIYNKKGAIAFFVMFLVAVNIPHLSALSFNGDNVSIKINESKITFPDQQPFIENGRVLVPIRFLSENLDYKIEWNEDKMQVILSQGDKVIEIKINKKYVNINFEKKFTLDVPARILNRRTMVPLRFVTEVFGNEVYWNQETKTVSIETNNIKQEKFKDIKLHKFNINGTLLRQGMLSNNVYKLKYFFNKLNNLSLTLNYMFDEPLHQAIIEYQEENKFIVDGIVGEQTFSAINQDILQNTIVLPVEKIEFRKEIPKEDWIIINKSNNMLYHLSGDTVIEKYNIATGREPHFTPNGQFFIVNKLVNPYWGGAGRQAPVQGGSPDNPLGYRWMGLNIGNGGLYGIHGNNDANSIGRYVSLGCIRMFNIDVESLYEKIPINTPVWIGDEGTLNSFGVFFGF